MLQTKDKWQQKSVRWVDGQCGHLALDIVALCPPAFPFIQRKLMQSTDKRGTCSEGDSPSSYHVPKHSQVYSRILETFTHVLSLL